MVGIEGKRPPGVSFHVHYGSVRFTNRARARREMVRRLAGKKLGTYGEVRISRDRKRDGMEVSGKIVVSGVRKRGGIIHFAT